MDFTAPLMSMSSFMSVSLVLALCIALVMWKGRTTDSTNKVAAAGRLKRILDRAKSTKPARIRPVAGTPANPAVQSHKDSPTVPAYACWDDVLLVGNVLGAPIPVGPGEDYMKKCSAECHKKKTCTHFEFKDGSCILKDRAVAFVDKNFRDLNQKSPFEACNGNVRCADGFDKGRKTCLDSIGWQLDAPRTLSDGKAGPTNRKAMNDMSSMLTEAHKQANKSKVWDILSVVFTVVSVVLAPFAAFTGPLAAIAGVVDLAVVTADTVTGTIHSVRDAKDNTRYARALENWAKTPNDIPVFFYHNMPKGDGDRMVWGYQCVQGAKLRGELCKQNDDTGIAWNQDLGVTYWNPNDKRSSVCCQPRKDQGKSSGKCDDMFDPNDDGACNFNSGEYKDAYSSSKDLIKSAAWQNRPPAANNYSNTMLSFVLKHGGLIS